MNVHSGCKEAVLYHRLISFVKKENPDVLALLELNGWNSNNFHKLRRFKQQVGMPYSVFCKSPHGYHLALFSKMPFKSSKKIEAGMWHGAIKAELVVDGTRYSIITTHLSPIDEDMRLRDIDTLMRKFKFSSRTILVGDMNSLSYRDIINSARLLKILNQRGVKKFGRERLRMEVIRTLLDKNLVDAVRLKTKSPGRSVPTKINVDRAHVTPLRIDYIFVSEDLRNKVSSARIIRTKQTANITDHFPVAMVI